MREIKAHYIIIRAFVKLRQRLASNRSLARKLAEMEKRFDAQFKVVFDAVRQLMAPPPPSLAGGFVFRVLNFL